MTGGFRCHTVGGIPTVVLLGYNENGKIFEFPQDRELMTPNVHQPGAKNIWIDLQ